MDNRAADLAWGGTCRRVSSDTVGEAGCVRLREAFPVNCKMPNYT